MYLILEDIKKNNHVFCERMINMKHRRKIAVLLFLIIFLILQSGCSDAKTVAPTPDTASKEVPAEEVTPDIDKGPAFFIEYVYTRELITTYYHLYETVLDDFAEIYLTNNSNETSTFLVETEIDGYSTVSSDTVEVAPGECKEIRQNPRLIPESMDKLNAQRYANFVIRVTLLLSDGEDDLLLNESKEILLYSRRDYTWVDGFDLQENHDFLAAYVTPNDPVVEELLRRAADYTSTGQMWSGYSGYTNDEDGAVWDRLQAIWQAEKDYNLTYVSTWVSFTLEKSQRMRLPYEVMEQSGGNCIELVFLFASAVEAIDVECSIVLIPGHAYLAVRTDQETSNYYFIETTLIGQADFNAAVNYGFKSWSNDGPKVESNEAGYGWVNIYEARERGILPVPWR